jgi:CubicO group peptidase (beta-lactamase class C family)/transketolase C-terminal domain/subunit
MAAVRMLGNLLKDPTLGPRIVPIVADEARTFGMASLFRQIGIYAPGGQQYEPEDRESMLYYREARDGQLLEEGINEAGAMSSWIAAATSYAVHGLPMLPVYIYYSMFGFQRVGDLIWAAADQRSRGFLFGATAGRTTLGGEGLQHQDGSSLLVASTVPNCVAWDPAHAGEVAVILEHAMQRMLVQQCDEFHYLTLMNENQAMPSLPAGARDDLIKGLYRLQALAPPKARRRVRLLGSGAILREVSRAAQLLADEHGIDCEVFSATSYSELAREARDLQRLDRSEPLPQRRVSHVGRLLAGDAPIVAASDYVRASSPWAPTASAAATRASNCAVTSRSMPPPSWPPRSRRCGAEPGRRVEIGVCSATGPDMTAESSDNRPRKPARGWLMALVAALGLLVMAIVWLALRPPELVRLAAGYAAKIVCSNVFIAGRDPQEVLRVDVQAPGHPLLRGIRVTVDLAEHTVRAGLYGSWGGGLAVWRPGTGCATVPDGKLAQAESPGVPGRPVVAPVAPWPQGDPAAPVAGTAALAAALADEALAGPGVRAVAVVHRGVLVAERYAPGFDARTPLLGWSMTKTVTAALVGTLVRDGRIAPAQKAPWPAWAGDARAGITWADLMAMSSGLAFNEDYGSVTDITRMLYLEPDMAAFAGSQPSQATPGAKWSYASGTTVLLARLWQSTLPDPKQALAYPRQALFQPLGMASAVMEADARGTFVGSSYLYATARDWARFGQFLLQDGAWNGQRLLPEGFVATMREPVPASAGLYGKGQVWLAGPGRDRAADASMGVPADTFWMNGHDGQHVILVPSRELVVVRLGLTPPKLGYRPQRLLAAVLRAAE